MTDLPTISGIDRTPMGLIIAENLSLQDWSIFGAKLVVAEKVLRWWVADWAAHGERKYGHLITFASEEGRDYGTLSNQAYTARKVELSRRRESLSFGHHTEVAPLPDKLQTKWLEIAEREKLSIVDLRKRIRESLCDENALESDGRALKTIGSKFDDWKSFLMTRPADWWDDEKRRIWRERLRPVVEFYQTL